MPTFHAPTGYGTKDQHVISPAQHLGYVYLAAYLVDGGNSKDYIMRACADAHEDGAPKDVVCRANGQWKRRSEMNLGFGRRLDTYAKALTKYEQELKAEWANERST